MFWECKTQQDKKLFLDGFCRAVLYDHLMRSKYKDSKKVRDYIMYEASFNKVYDAVLGGKSLLSEDATQTVKLNEIENWSDMLMQLGPAILMMPASEARIKTLAAKIFTNSPKAVSRLGFAGGFVIPFIIFTIINKLLFAFLRKTVSRCRKDCKIKYDNDKTKFKNLKIQVCTSQCKIADLEKVIARFRGDIAKCSQTKNPEQCQTALVKDVGKMNELLQKEKITLQQLLTSYKTRTMQNTQKEVAKTTIKK